jgi:hypothetical protein
MAAKSSLLTAQTEQKRADIVAKIGGWQLGRNNRITTIKSLNQHCASGSVLCVLDGDLKLKP